MNRMNLLLVAAMASMCFVTAAQADYANGPNPYDPIATFAPTGLTGFGTYGAVPPSDDPDVGFNLPSVGYSGTISDPLLGTPVDGPDVVWGGWNRLTPGTIWAEWDTYTGDPNPAPADGSYGATSATFGWSAGTFAAGSGNLYSFTADSVYQINIDVSALTGLNQVALQVEQFAPLEVEWNQDHTAYVASDAWTMSLDGGSAVARDSLSYTFYGENFPTTFGPVDLPSGILLWENVDLTGITTLTIDFDNPVHTSLAQVAVDIGPVPEPATMGLLAVGGLIMGLRRKR